MREAAALRGEDAVMRVLGGIFRYADPEGRPLLHALEDIVDAVGAFPCDASLPRHDMVLLAHPLLGPFDRQPMIAGEGFHPGLVVGGPLPQDLLADHWNADHLTEEVHNLLRARETAEVAVNDNAVEAVVDEREHVTEQLGEQFHGNPRTGRSGSKNHQAWTGQADRRGQGFSARR